MVKAVSAIVETTVSCRSVCCGYCHWCLPSCAIS